MHADNAPRRSFENIQTMTDYVNSFIKQASSGFGAISGGNLPGRYVVEKAAFNGTWNNWEEAVWDVKSQGTDLPEGQSH